jgi:sugar/nucleoside kinase (ribokinase family)
MHYVAIGHVCQDLLPDGWMFGGAATYSSRMARALGCHVQVLTSLDPAVDVTPALADIEVLRYPSDRTTTFENVYTSAGRHQTLHAVAERLTPDRFPEARTADVVHLAPIAQEVDLGWLDHFRGALVGVTPQGWLRQWDQQGRVSPTGWVESAVVLPRADVVIISIEDVAHNEELVQQWAGQARMLVVTRGAQGCTVHQHGITHAVPTHAVNIVDATGAGDIFAAAFLVRLRQCGDPLTAARFANCLASQSITRRGLDSIPTSSEIEQCLVV